MSLVTSEGNRIGGRYALVRTLGRGGMAEVWEAEDEVLRRRVAVKLFHGTGDADDTRREVAEMHTLAGLSHPNLVTVYDAGRDGDRPYLVMELVDGATLADRIRAQGDVDATWVAAVGTDLASGLAYIHRRGIVHRDVKPANVMLPDNGHGDGPAAKLVDFGIAQHAGQEKLTRTGMTIGTARYLAPEQVTGKPVGPAADVYALGIVLLEALGCGPAWTGTPIEIALARLAAPPPVPADLGPVWTPLLVAMTATDPLARPGATQVREALTVGVVPVAVTRELPPVAATTRLRPVAATTRLLPMATPPRDPRTRRRLAVIGAGVLAAGAAATVVAIALAARSSDPTTPGGGAGTSPAAAVSSASSAAPSASTVSAPTAAAPTTAATTPPVVTSAAETPPGPGGPGKVPPGQTKSKGKDKAEG